MHHVGTRGTSKPGFAAAKKQNQSRMSSDGGMKMYELHVMGIMERRTVLRGGTDAGSLSVPCDAPMEPYHQNPFQHSSSMAIVQNGNVRTYISSSAEGPVSALTRGRHGISVTLAVPRGTTHQGLGPCRVANSRRSRQNG